MNFQTAKNSSPRRGPVVESGEFAASVLDALSSTICVVDKRGVIIAVNQAWKRFALANPPVSNSTDVGALYLDVCRKAKGRGSDGAKEFGEGVRAVLDRRRDVFELEYPCPSPDKFRWFSGHVTPLKGKLGGAVISHYDITDRKLLELKLAKLAAIDPLTELPNRRYFIECADLEVERIGRFGGTASLIMADIDHFKSINDKYGHDVGDQTLRCVARACEGPLRQSDVLARLGGEEFVIMLAGTPKSGAIAVADKLREAVSGARIRSGRKEFSITASFGVAEIRAGDRSIIEALRRADTALYAAKRGGRNRVRAVR